MMAETVIVGISGGVDSAVAAWLLLQQGYDVQGLFMSNWDEDDAYCTIADDYQDARRVCERLAIPLHRVSFAREYRDRVFSYFLDEYRSGRTPNPDVLCNRDIKFGVSLTYMQRLGANRIATGHYARVAEATEGGVALLKGVDPGKDQSYFLHAVPREALAQTLFPLGGLHKTRVRELAHEQGLPVFDKPDSTGICFIGERPFREFLSRYVATAPGPIETAQGRVIGEHQGLAFYTLGQRAGLGLGGQRGAQEAPWFVAEKNVSRNALVVVQEPDHPLLLTDVFTVSQAHWLAPLAGGEWRCGVKTRYRQRDLPCAVSVAADGTVRVMLDTAARAVTPGQFAVFYDADRCLGGGVIQERALTRAIAYNTGLLREVS
jgi:tRNA-uridine 2-sulfurtransferase